MSIGLGLGLGLGGRSSGPRNQAPTDISLSASTIAEDADLGEVVGALSGTDPEGEAITFSMVDDAGGLFDISGSNLIVSGVLDFETSASHSITIRATDIGGRFFDEVFNITVTDVSESPPSEDPPPDDGDIEDDGTFTNPPVVTTVDGGIKLSGKKASGSTGKFIYDLGPFEANTIYTMKYDPDFSLLAQQGKLAMVGFGMKDGNSFRLSGLRGDGSTGLHAYEVSGSSPNGWSQTTGHTTSDGGAAAHGTQSGPNWLRIQIAEDGSTYSLRTSSDGVSWTDEFTDITPSPFTNSTDPAQAGIIVYLDGTDAGSFSVLVTLWRTQILDAFRGSIVNNASDSGSTNFNNTTLTFDSETVDTDTLHSTSSNTSRFTIPAGLNGRYAILHAQVELTSVTGGSNGYAFISKGGAGSGDFDGAGLQNQTLNTALLFGWINVESQPVVLATNDIFEVVLACSDTTTILQSENSHWSIEVVG